MKAVARFSKRYNYIAEDSDGTQWLYDAMPVVSGNHWKRSSSGTDETNCKVTFDLGDNWKESLHKIDHVTGELEKVIILPDLPVDTKVLVRDFEGENMRENVYYRYGKPYRKLKRDEKILPGAMFSWCHGELRPIMHTETIGQTPNDFSEDRDFYNPIKID